MIDVSVIIPTYNRPELTMEAVRSCQQQSGCSVEIIVVHDGEDLQERYGEGVKQIYQEHGQAAVARNRGLKEAQGTYVKFLDADDLLTPESLYVQIQDLEQTQADVSVGQWRYCDAQGNPDNDIHREYHEDMVSVLIAGFWNANFSYLLRRSWLLEHDCHWNANYPVLQDFAFMMDVGLKNAQFIASDVKTGCYRNHSLDRRVSQASSLTRAQNYYHILQAAQNSGLPSPLHKILINAQMQKIAAMEDLPTTIVVP